MAASLDPSATITTAPVTDPFEQLLNLEETFYQQGYQLGHQDGAQQGLVEGRIFGMERGFDKFFEMARLHGHSVILGNQIPAVRTLQTELKPIVPDQKPDLISPDPGVDVDVDLAETELQPLSSTSRLEKHIRTLYALTEPASLSLQNNEDDISEFDDRFKRAQAKVTILSKMIGYDMGVESRDLGNASREGDETEGGKSYGQSKEASIEDASILKARH